MQRLQPARKYRLAQPPQTEHQQHRADNETQRRWKIGQRRAQGGDDHRQGD
jgi:hypothetical protein